MEDTSLVSRKDACGPINNTGRSRKGKEGVKVAEFRLRGVQGEGTDLLQTKRD